MLKTAPAVFAVGKNYQIMVEVECESLMSLKVGENIYYDETNGIMNSLSPIHRITVPMDELNEAKEYTVCIRPITERLPYFTKTEEPLEFSFKFKPVPNNGIRVYHISDAHNQTENPIKAAKAFGDIDMLILNGDIIDHSGSMENFRNIYTICSELTNGSIPVVFSRGNHDMRGNFAEKFADYTPNQNGNTYYSFRLGSIWGLVVDCGEDKYDSCDEYGHTVACHCFRKRQTEYIKSVIEHAENEYAAPGIKTRLVIAHNPFTYRSGDPFNIEEDIYREWSALLREQIKPQLMICGHTHSIGINHKGGELDNYGQPCTVVIASEPRQDKFIGCGFIIGDDKIETVFTDSSPEIVLSESFNKQ